ncbi:MAG: cell envelope integrity protein TolA [Pseudomonadota bacterium]
MHAYAYPSRQEKVISGAFAFGMHLVFLALLVFGVTWQKRIEPQANIVDLWANLPSPAPPKVELPPPKPELKLEVKPPKPPPVKPVAKPEIPKPDIAMKEKAMKAKAEKEKAEKEKAKKEAAAKAAQKLQQEKEAEAKAKAEQEQREAMQKLAQQQASAQARLRNEYIERIRSRIKRFVVMPPNMQGNPEAEFDVVLLPGGEVLSVKLRRASGNAAYDSAVERAIHKAAPLPLPPDPALFRDFRELNLKFRSQE